MQSLSIGAFAEVTHLSVRTLRRYHESGLLEPASVDPFTGYRRYTGEQIATAQVIHRLRQLDVPLAEVRRIIGAEDPEERAGLVAGHLRRLEGELQRTRAAVSSLRQLLRPDPGGLRVELRAEPARPVAAVRGRVALEELLGWYDAAMGRLDAAVAGRAVTGPPGGTYAGELFSEGVGEAVVYRPVTDPPHEPPVEPVDLPAVELATVVHHGSHDDIDVTYGRLGAWVLDNALVVDGPVRETYLVGPRDDPDPAAWRTEIGWPVFRLARV